MDEVGLPAQESRCLQDIDHGRHVGDLLDGMHIGQHRHIQLVADVGQYLQTFVLARTAIRLTRAAVGLVERAFVDEGYAQLASHFLQDTCRIESHLARLDHAGSRDQEKRLSQAGFESASFNGYSFLVASRSEQRRGGKEWVSKIKSRV